MDLFYIRHHYLSIVRSSSFVGEVYALIILLFLGGSMVPLLYTDLDMWVTHIGSLAWVKGDPRLLVLIAYLVVDMGLKSALKRPGPMTKYYLLIKDVTNIITRQYLFVSLFGIIPLLLFILSLVFMVKASIWSGSEAGLSIFLYWLVNHYIGLWSQYRNRLIAASFLMIYVIIGLSEMFFPSIGLIDACFNPLIGLFLLAVAVMGAKSAVSTFISSKLVSENKRISFLEGLTKNLHFKNPLFQLEFMLILRNKRTRTNIISAFILIPFFLFNPTSYENPDSFLVIAFLMTNLFSIQHGMYSFGWESSYFDFLLTNYSARKFFNTRWTFLMMLNLVGLVFCVIASIITGISLLGAICMFLYGCGVCIPFILYRNQYHDSRIELSESAFANYKGVMTGPLFVSSLLSLIIPILIYFLGQALFSDLAILIFGLLGIIGLALKPVILTYLTKSFRRKKYHLSQSLKA